MDFRIVKRSVWSALELVKQTWRNLSRAIRRPWNLLATADMFLVVLFRVPVALIIEHHFAAPSLLFVVADGWVGYPSQPLLVSGATALTGVGVISR